MGTLVAARVGRRISRLFFCRRLRDRFFYRLQRILADHALVLLVERQHRLAPHGLLRRRQHVHFGGLGRLYFRQRVVVFLFRDVPYVLGRVAHRLGETLSNIRRQAVPEFLVDDHRVHHHAVVRQRHVLLHLVHLLRVLVRGCVLLAVDDALLQGGVDLGERHHLRDRAEGLDLALEDLGGLD